jgi:5'-nucleotidase / UDP-sugar diphosphatase
MKRLLSLVLAVSLTLVLGAVAAGAAPPSLPLLPADVSITILHTNDMHSRAIESKSELGYSRIATLVSGFRAANPNTLVLDAGDAFHGLPFANLEQGASIVKLMNAVGYDYMTTGNHDYNYGLPRLFELEKQASFKILAANVYTDGKRLFAPWVIRNLGGVRVAIFGLATPETAYKADPKLIQGIRFADPIEEARSLVAALAGKYDLLVLISHLGIDASSDVTSVKVADAVPEIDLIIDGHSHSSLASVVTANDSNTLIASADSYGTSLGLVELVVGPYRTVTSRSAKTLTLANNPGLASDPKVKTLADEILAAQGPLLAEKVGQTEIALQGKREIVRVSETNLGKLIANSMRAATGADVAFIGGGGIRDSIPAGPISKKDIFTVMPFGNNIQTATFKGSEFKAIIEHGVGKLPAPDGRFPHFAGLEYRLDASKAPGSRVSDIRIGGEAVDPDRDYVLAATNFNFNGGDDFKMLTGKSLQDFPSDAEIFMSYVRRLGTVTEDTIELK